MAKNNKVPHDVHNVSRGVPMVISTSEVQTTWLGITTANGVSLWAETIYDGMGTSRLTDILGNVFQNNTGQMAHGLIPRAMIQQALPILMIPTLVIPNEKSEKFTDVGFKQWQSKIFFYLIMLNLVKYLLKTCPIIFPNEQDVTMLRASKARKYGDFICPNCILNCLVNFLCNVYCNIEIDKQLWESLEKKYKTEDFSMVDSKSIMNPIREVRIILKDIFAKGMLLSGSFRAVAIIEKLPPS